MRLALLCEGTDAVVLIHVMNGLTFGALLFVLASGFTIILGLMRIVNLAFGAFFLLGGYIGMTVQEVTGSFVVAMIAGGLALGVIGAVSERFLLRPIRNEELPEVLLTFGVSLIIADGILVIWGGNPEAVTPPPALSGSVTLLGLSYPSYRIFVLAVAVAMGVIIYILQYRTRIGCLVRAGVDDREMIQALGTNIDRVFSSVFIFGSALAGVSGVIGAGFLGLATGEDLTILLLALVVVVVGGFGSLHGAAVGSLLIGLIDAFGKAYVPQLSYFAVFAPMLIILTVRPQGIFGRTTSP